MVRCQFKLDYPRPYLIMQAYMTSSPFSHINNGAFAPNRWSGLLVAYPPITNWDDFFGEQLLPMLRNWTANRDLVMAKSRSDLGISLIQFHEYTLGLS